MLAAAVLCDRAMCRGSKRLILDDLQQAADLSNLRAVCPEDIPYTQEELRVAAETWRDMILEELDAEGHEITPQEPD